MPGPGASPRLRRATRQPGLRQRLLDLVAPLDMARHEDRQKVLVAPGEAGVDVGDDRLLARMGRQRGPARPVPDRLRKLGQRGLVAGRRPGVGLQVAADADRMGAEEVEALGVDVGLRDDMGEVLEQRLGERRRRLPALERIVGQAGVDQHLRDPPAAELQHRHRPDLALGHHRKVRAPVVEEAHHRWLDVERHELVDGAVGEAVADEPCRGHRAGGHHDVDAFLGDGTHQRGDRRAFADARGVHPDERPLRGPSRRSKAVALAPPRRILLAARDAVADIRAEHRIGERADEAVGGECGAGEGVAHPPTPASSSARWFAASIARVTSWRFSSINAASASAGTRIGAPITTAILPKGSGRRRVVPGAGDHMGAAGDGGGGQDRPAGNSGEGDDAEAGVAGRALRDVGNHADAGSARQMAAERDQRPRAALAGPRGCCPSARAADRGDAEALDDDRR